MIYLGLFFANRLSLHCYLCFFSRDLCVLYGLPAGKRRLVKLSDLRILANVYLYLVSPSKMHVAF